VDIECFNTKHLRFLSQAKKISSVSNYGNNQQPKPKPKPKPKIDS